MSVGQEFAQVVLDAFRLAGVRSDSDVAQTRGPSTTTMSKMRKAALGEMDLPKPRRPTMDAIDRTARWAPGSAERVWEGGEPQPAEPELPPNVRPIGDPEDELVEFRVSGAFGVQAIVRGPIRDIDALQKAVSKLIAGMSVEDANNGV